MSDTAIGCLRFSATRSERHTRPRFFLRDTQTGRDDLRAASFVYGVRKLLGVAFRLLPDVTGCLRDE